MNLPEAVISTSAEDDALEIAADAAIGENRIYHVWRGRMWGVQPAILLRPLLAQHAHAIAPSGPTTLSGEARRLLLWRWREAAERDLAEGSFIFDQYLLRDDLALATSRAPRSRPTSRSAFAELLAWGCLRTAGSCITNTGRHLARRIEPS